MKNILQITFLHRASTTSMKKRLCVTESFYLSDHDVYVEYWGLVDADDKKVKDKFVRTMKWKMRQYYEAGIKFNSIYPKNLSNLDWIFRKKFEDVTGYRLP